MKILVAIANHGTKNAKYLERLLSAYRSMTTHQADLVVLSNTPKDLGPDVEVIVGTPSSDPWSLPFGYKPLFADRVDHYDLFIYSEDDTLITERHINAFVDATDVLPDQYLAGFLRYETSPDGAKYYSTLHSHYHWDTHSVRRVGEYVFAYYSNEHSACFILTRKQLKAAIASGGFMKPARTERYDMLVTAATDPYTQCGMRKVICISHLDDFCLHHLPDIYCGRIGVEADIVNREIDRLKSLSDVTNIPGPLFAPRTLLEGSAWNKSYYESPRSEILSLVPRTARRILSVGCGCGSTESELVKTGAEVTGIPLDCVVGVTAQAQGVRVLPPDLEAAKKALRGQRFDCVIFSHILHHLPDPVSAIKDFLNLLEVNALVILSVPNFGHPTIFQKRWLKRDRLIKNWFRPSFENCGVHFTTRGTVASWLKECKLKVVGSTCKVEPHHEWVSRLTLRKLDGVLSRKIVLAGSRA